MPPPDLHPAAVTKRDLDRVATELHIELQKLRAEFYRDQRKQDLIAILAANAVVVIVVLTASRLLAG